jgi:Asp/Glu/hydantoin racemase
MDESSIPMVEFNLDSYGLRSRAVSHRPVRSPAFYEDMSRWFRDEHYLRSAVLPRFDAVALELINDGAEVIVTACGGYAILPIAGHTCVPGTSVPIVDATVAGAHMARLLGSLRKDFGISTSKVGGYQNPLNGPGGELLEQLLSGSPYPTGRVIRTCESATGATS